jgi:hypothetical protein
MRSRALLIGVNLFVTAVLLEGLLQVLDRTGRSSTVPKLRAVHAYLNRTLSWERYFLKNHQRGEFVYLGVHEPHPTRGWAMKPGVRTVRGGKTYTINRQGFRSLHDFDPRPDRYQVLIVGDSFTFGDDASDDETWPYFLGTLDARLHVLNMGGTGYGTDQMLITISEEIAKYKPDLVISAFVSDDLYRAMLEFRDYKKPRFRLSGGSLVLTNTPIEEPDDVLRELERDPPPPHSHVRTLNLLSSVLTGPADVPVEDACNEECLELNRAIFVRKDALARRYGAEFLAVALPKGLEVDGHDAGAVPAENRQLLSRLPPHIPTFDPTPALGRQGFHRAHFKHYRAEDSKRIAALVRDAIRKLSSWRERFGEN